MYDANGKNLNGGLLAGKFSSFGSYDQCLGVKTTRNQTTILGKYCLVDLKVPLPEIPKTFERAESKILALPRKTQVYNFILFAG